MRLSRACAALAALSCVAATGASGVTIPLRRHHERRAQPLPWKSYAEAAGNVPVAGNYEPFGVFYTDIYLGTPGQSYAVAIDTGSYRTIVTDASCTSCNSTSKRAYHAYDARASSTSKATGKPFSNSYKTCDIEHPTRTCTIRGAIYEDVFEFPGVGKGRVHFGSITSQTLNFVQFESIHGLMGTDSLDGGDNFGDGTPIMNLSPTKANVYAMCFRNNGHGKMTIGGTDPSLHTAPFVYTPMEFDLSISIAVKAMSVNGAKVAMRATTAVLDSGTNYLLMPSFLFTALKSAFPAGLDGVEDLFAGKVYNTDPKAWPTIAMELEGLTLSLTPDAYLEPVADGSGYTLGVVNTGFGPSAMFIIGDSVMSQYYMVYDRKGGRVGWAPPSEKCFADN